ncbi:MAG: NADH:flavin oxidoreductase/NADH oxidase, partial [Nakamurella sp.]
PTVGPSTILVDDYATPDELSVADFVVAFSAAAAWAVEVGYQVIEIHAARGYPIHEFLSPLSNQRTDRFGGDGRPQLLLDAVDAVPRSGPPSRSTFHSW